MMRPLIVRAAALVAGAVGCAAAAVVPGTWTTPPVSSGLPLLLDDGSVLQQTGFDSAQWQVVRPGADGRYDFAHPTPRATMHSARGFFASTVLRDGRVFVAGGEYGGDDHGCEVYDPVHDTWTTVVNQLGVNFSDCNAITLPDGRVLVLPNGPTTGAIWDPVGGGWTRTSANAFTFNESSATQLPGGAFLVNNPSGYPTTAKYLAASDRWVPAADQLTGAAAISSGGEIGSRVLLYDGRAMAFGNVGPTAFYLPGSDPAGPGSWQPGPTVPDHTKMQDQFAVVMANGHVLVAGDQGGHTGPTRIYDFDPATNVFTDVSPVAGGIASYSDPYMALLLPTGEVMVAGLGVYAPAVGAPSAAWRPTITQIADLGGGAYRLTGTQLNGLTEGAYYGDDAQMPTNRPLVRLTSSSGAIAFARTGNCSTMALATGATPVTTDFTLPALADGAYTLQVVTNAVASSPFAVRIAGGRLTSGTTTGGTTTGGTTTSGTTSGGTTTGGTTTGGTTSGTTTSGTTSGGTATGGTTSGTTTSGTTSGGTTTSGTTTSSSGGSGHHGGCGSGAGFAVAAGLLLALHARRVRS